MNKRQGNTFLIVIAVLGIIFYAASSFVATTIEESRQTTMSIRGMHALSLAEAALERTMTKLTEGINKVDPDKASSNDFGIKLRLPAKAKSGGFSIKGNLGEDTVLELPASLQSETTYTESDLQGDGNDELDKLVNYMSTGEEGTSGVKEYHVEVKVSIDKAFKIGSGDEYPDYKVPGVDIEWNLRPDVKKFLNGDGYTPIAIEFPSDLKWLSFTIPIEFFGIKIAEINVVDIVDNALKGLGVVIKVNGNTYGLKELSSLDGMARLIINDVICKNSEKKPYPIGIDMDKIDMPKDVSKLWPSGTNVSESEDSYLEKYGQMKITSKAEITYEDGFTTRRTITAIKDFKVADCEPIAPMYSFFIANLNNDLIQFNNYGGDFLVTNFDYSGLLGKVKDLFTGTGGYSSADLEKREFPGLIRVNYKPSGDDHILCNVGLLGDPQSPKLKGDNPLTESFKNVVKGMDVVTMIAPKTAMSVVSTKDKISINGKMSERKTDKNDKVPEKMKPKVTSGQGSVSVAGSVGKYDVEVDGESKPSTTISGIKDYMKQIGKSMKPNLIPDISKLSCNVIEYAATLVGEELKETKLAEMNANGIKFGSALLSNFPSSYQRWEMPYMGTSNNLYCVPTTGTGSNKSHLFGFASLSPTMTREIEGDVLKQFRQWKMVVVGMEAKDRIPTPWGFSIPPIPIPVWGANPVGKKYGYSLTCLQPRDENLNLDNKVYSYDPGQLQNLPPNLYTSEQYVKKATYYYESGASFTQDLPNRMTQVNGKEVFVLNGITYVSGSLGSAGKPFYDGDFLVVGKGAIVCSGNIFLGGSINVIDRSEDEKTVFSLISRGGALLCMSDNQIEIEGSLYTDKGIYCTSNSSVHILGNWVTNNFNKSSMAGTVAVDYVSSRVRTSLGSLHPTRGKYDPHRYNVSFAPTWASWRVE